MAKLTTAARNKISGSNFALPGRRYPIEDAAHARNALARVAQHGTAEEKAKVRAAVHRKYPDIGEQRERDIRSNDRRNDDWGPIRYTEPHARQR